MKKKGKKWLQCKRKKYLIVKGQYKDKAEKICEDTCIKISREVHLGSVIGSKQFSENYISSLITQWVWRNNRINFNRKDSSAGSIFCICIRLQTEVHIHHEDYWKHWKLHITLAQSYQTKVDTSFIQWFLNIRRTEKLNSTSM